VARDGSGPLFGSLCLLFALTNLARTAFAPLVETLRTAFAASPAEVGVVVSLAWVGSAAGRPASAYLATRLSAVRVVVVAGGVLVAGSAAAALAPSLAVLRVAALVAGLSSGVYIAAAVPLVGDLFPEGVGRALGTHGAASQVAAVAAPGVVLAALWAGSWRVAFGALAVVAVAATVGLAVAAAVADLPPAAAPDPDLRAALAGWRVLAAGVAVVATAGFVWQGVFNFYVTFLVTERGVSPGVANGALSLLFAAGIPGMALGGRVADRVPTVPLLLGLVTTFALGVVALTLAPGLAGLLAATVVVGVAVHAVFPSLDTYVLGCLPPEGRSSAYALFSGVALTLEAPGSAAVGWATAGGATFGGTFRTFALALLPVVAALAAAYLGGRFPVPRSDTPT
jgi:MFS family permease